MFAEFRALYPAGQLICELLTIHHGKFVVRCLVQVDGKTLATGMSAAESVEEAEDRARSRAMAVLAFDAAPAPVAAAVPVPAPAPAPAPVAAAAVPVPIAPPPAPAVPVPVGPALAPLPVLEMPVPDKVELPHQSNFVNTEAKLNQEPIAPVAEPLPPKVDLPPAVGFVPKQLDSDAWLSSSYGEPLPELEVPPQSDRELSQGAAEVRESQPIAVGIPSDAIEDDSDTIAQIDAILKRLRWTKKQETDCLEQNYGKSSQRELASEQLADFLEYLEIYSRTTEEIKRLGWTANQGKDYLKQGYGKEARHFLNREELFDFLQYLESLP
ncbi:MAG: hypothetical protein JGK17_17925 [Microcoleus sp. PH2017_10_PVI_O_A]|uniref:hypothetical protein n=1 Tax=unclassified Microcoleus TaxID=2642155 RepID=UPI001E0CEB3B|nr:MULTISPECIES: hypothetical protein [unclassified Microcoleus]TAE80755.1 MAG: hypothetical protein EAZ83_17235 [Oscillatoriales cyanobacterium]MCC3407431.1 hypothetical protein [Microcoleus sp. PH2017_10_PVI_O_A]MCC3461511.1 hypothetical protein [Microcoleus sp. PH2017_11_PCY_U_A]MCC3479985.1 hypothetical protein [Microcoleus sp. PH2017_12_PCY_D_A]MCC3529791.1 hypothetical protein [Microcoleus sp. PH2017_21_RUC_O_A]